MADNTVTIVLPPDLPPERMRAILDAIGPDVAVQDRQPSGIARDTLGGIDAVFDRVAESSRNLPGLIERASQEVQAASGHSIAGIVLISLAVLVAAYLAERALRLATPDAGKPASGSFAARLRATFVWAMARIGSLAVFAVIAILINRAIIPAGMPRQIFAIVGSVVLVQRVLYTVLELIAAPADPQRRLVPWSDAQARWVARALAVQIAVVGAVRIVAGVVSTVSGGGAADDGVQIGANVAWWLVVTVFFFLVRREFGDLIRRWAGGSASPGPSPGPGPRPGRIVQLAADYWPYVATVLAFGVALGEISQTLTAGRSAAFGFVMLIFILTPFVLAAIGVLKAERATALTGPDSAREAGWFALAEGLTFIAAVVLLLDQWQIDPFGATQATGLAALAPAIVSALCVAIVGWAAWRAIAAFIAAYQPAGEADDSEGDGLGREGSRLGTALPVIRGFLWTLIVAVTVMVALSALGVNIGPLIAGAGIFGLAIGFGSQKLVADVISGFFYLYEDAFRVGEYVVSDNGKGVVERISLRSVRLRHHRGAIYTIPFSSMGTVENHSRDWVKIKFSFDVPAATDVERVRKLVKKVGQTLMEDPDLEGKFLEPLKSQGAVAIKGAGFEIGVKYMCKPGQQFLIRRKAFAALQDAFRENGIELLKPTITFSNAEDGLSMKDRPV